MTALLFFSFAALAQIPIVDVGPAQIERADSVSVLSRADIERAYAQSSDDVLRTVPGISVVRSGGPGQPSLIYIRGGDSSGTLVLVDGLPVNDPSLNNSAFDFSLLSLDGVERVEVWKGPQSVLFGSGATGGVINIVTVKGKGPPRSGLGVEAGSFETWKLSAQSSGGGESGSYALSAFHLGSAGISAASGGTERDGVSMSAASAKLGWTHARNGFELVARYLDKYSALDYSPMDSAPYVFADDRNYWVRGHSLALGLAYTRRWSDEFQSLVRAKRFAQVREYVDDPEPANPAWLKSRYDGEVYHVENVNSLKLAPGSDLQFGPAAESESASSQYLSSSYSGEFARQRSSIVGGFARWQLDRETYFATLGARYDVHSRFGSQPTFEVQPGLHLTPDLDVLARVATGYKAPTLFELFDPQSGNPTLTSERALGYELTLTRFFEARRSRLQVSLFKNEYRDLIATSGLKFANVGSARAEGVEVEARKDLRLADLQVGYTYLETRDNRTGLSLLRRPRNSLSARVGVRPSDGLHASLDWISADHREDLGPISNARMVSASYQALNATLEWQARVSLKVYARVINLLDAKYEESAGYGSYRRSVFAGMVYGL